MNKFNSRSVKKLNNLFRNNTVSARKALGRMPENHKYLLTGKYSKNCPKWFLKKFDMIDKKQLYSWFLTDVAGVVLQELDRKKYKVITTRNWRKSRFISAENILRKRLRTCGTMALLVACGLRHLGIPTKLINGYFAVTKEKSRHAWNEVYFPEYKKFLPMDITRLNYKISEKHIKVKECVDWEELDSPKNVF